MFDDKQEWLNTLRVPDGIGGFCISMMANDGAFQLIWIDSGLDEQLDSMIWHESLHATINILCGAGCHINQQEQETAAYTQGFIACTILDHIFHSDAENDEQSDDE
ncbi:hypothetical protein [Vibrio sp. PID23_8]|uniref:hypothetical protein n=1 Tax=Vibrio sp. PID23_8 TaxID=1583767 RepID=UPI000E6983E4|nr:hypothetical protein [Vibrio sp. PID23_8]RIZ56017.1 hypothetical protein AK966_05465 [Vibrio sp. PID23_8]